MKRESAINTPSDLERSTTHRQIPRSTTLMRIGSPLRPGFLLPGLAEPASPPARSISMTATTVTGRYGMTRLKSTGIMHGKISRTETRSCSWTPILFTTPGRRGICISPVNAIGKKPDPRWDEIRNNLGYILNYSRRLNLANLKADSSLCSTKVLPCPDTIRRCGVPGLRSFRWLIHNGSLGNAEFADAGG